MIAPAKTERTKEALEAARFRTVLRERGGETAGRCYQCGTCSSACDLALDAAPFPRRQMLDAQWGRSERLSGDPAIWLCHQCNDCTVRCPRDAKPGDVLQVLRAAMVERLAQPRILGKLVAQAGRTWPLLIGVPILFWVVLIAIATGFAIPESPFGYDEFVPHGLIYGVYFPATFFATWAVWASGRRFWTLIGRGVQRRGSFFGHLTQVVIEILTHKRFSSCGTSAQRKLGHLALLWGFIGAAVTSGLLILAMYGMGEKLPLPQSHPFKILGNISAVLLVVGGAMLVWTRWKDREKAGSSTAFDWFFLGLVALVIATGVAVELWRLALDPTTACILYVVHLGAVLCLFLTLPYSKFAHLLYRTLALVHERMTEESSPQSGEAS